jgi:hypothetical protein
LPSTIQIKVSYLEHDYGNGRLMREYLFVIFNSLNSSIDENIVDALNRPSVAEVGNTLGVTDEHTTLSSEGL